MPYNIILKPGGQQFTMPDHQTVLQAALKQPGLVLPYGCRSGNCGACKAKVISGEFSYPEGEPAAIGDRDRAENRVLLCQARPASDLVLEVREVGAVRDQVIKTLPCRVSKLDRLAPDVMQLDLQLPSTERLDYLAGQYLTLMLRDGRQRDFSLANAPDGSDLQLHIRLNPDGEFTRYIFEELKEKALLRLKGPLGTFFIRGESTRPILMMAGGTGFAPIKAMLESLFKTGLDRPVRFYWGCRARQDLYLHDLLESWATHYPQFSYIPVLSEPTATDRWTGRTGFVHAALAEDHPDLTGYDVYMAGPPVMIEAAKAQFEKQGLPEQQLFYDSFESSGS